MTGLDTWIGIMLGVGAASSASLGQTLQRLSRLRAEKLEVMPPPWRRPIWYLGQLLYTVANWLDVASLVYAPMSVIITIYALRLPMVAVMAALILRSTVTRRAALGIGIIAATAGTSMLTAPKEQNSPFESPKDFFTPAIVFYLVVSFSVWIFVGFTYWREQRQAGNPTAAFDSPLLRSMRIPLITAWVMTCGHMFNAGLGRLEEGVNWFQLEWIWLPITIATFSVAGGLLNLVGVENQCTHILIPMVFGFGAFFMGLQGMLFGEFEHATRMQTLFWSLGLVGAVIGTVVVSRQDDSDARTVGGADNKELSIELSAVH